jgi:hypothetical protein
MIRTLDNYVGIEGEHLGCRIDDKHVPEKVPHALGL